MLNYTKIQEAILYIVKNFEGCESEKPTVLHSIRCGLKLLDENFDTDIIVAGILHDVIEDTAATVEEIESVFGAKVAAIVVANTKDPTIPDKNVRRMELIKRCCSAGYDAVVVKLSDIYDNYTYYKAINDEKLVNYCLELKSYMLEFLSQDIHDDSYVKNILDKIQ